MIDATRERRDELLARSIAWIRANPRATNQDVPRDLRRAWMVDETAASVDRQMALVIFLAGHLSPAEFAAWQAHPARLSVAEAAERINGAFADWQVTLCLAQLNEGGEVRSEPCPLFAGNGQGDIPIKIALG